VLAHFRAAMTPPVAEFADHREQVARAFVGFVEARIPINSGTFPSERQQVSRPSRPDRGGGHERESALVRVVNQPHPIITRWLTTGLGRRVSTGSSMTESGSDPLIDRFDEAYVGEKTVDLVHGEHTSRIEIVRDLKPKGAGSR
jgi:hypothetical protein